MNVNYSKDYLVASGKRLIETFQAMTNVSCGSIPAPQVQLDHWHIKSIVAYVDSESAETLAKSLQEYKGRVTELCSRVDADNEQLELQLNEILAQRNMVNDQLNEIDRLRSLLAQQLPPATCDEKSDSPATTSNTLPPGTYTLRPVGSRCIQIDGCWYQVL